MREKSKTKKQLMEELESLRAQVAALVESTDKCKLTDDRYRLLCEESADGYAVINLEGYIQECNSAFSEMVGYTKDELCRMTYRDLTPDKWNHIEDEIIQEQLLTGTHSHIYEKQYKHKNGKIFPVELRTYLIRERNNQPTGIWAFIRDITQRKQAMEALQSERNMLEAVTKNIGAGLAIISKDYHTIWANDVIRNIFGETEGKVCYVTYHQRESVCPWCGVRRVFETGEENVVIEAERYKKDGIRDCLQIIATPIRDKNGEITSALELIVPITEHKQVEEALKESQQKLSDIINFLPDATLVIDKEGKVLAWNRAMEEMTGIKAGDMIGKGNYEYALPFYGERRPLLIDLALKPQEEIEAKYISTERKDLVLAGEAYMPALRGGEVYLSGKASIICNSRGNIIGAIESIRDITARKHAEESLAIAEEKYRNIFENAVMGIFQSTPDGNIISANQAFAHILGYNSPEEVLNTVTDMTRQLYVHPEWRAKLLQEVNQQGMFQEQEIQFFRKDGSIASIIINGRAVRDSLGKLLYYECAIQDITDRRLLESQLRQAHKMEAIGTLAGGIAHDFNNILSAVIGYAEMAQREEKESDKLQHYHNQIYNAGKRAKDLVKQILAFSRQSDEKPQPLRVSPIIKEVLKLLRASLPSTIKILQDIQSEPDTVLADPTHIHQILMNLCTNAAHAMRERKGELKVRLIPVEINIRDTLNIHHGLTPGMYLNMTVSDTGVGIDPGIMERIFDPFFTTKKPGEGSGMGLSVVHGIVKGYGGAITVESKAGKGSKFHVYLPLMKEAEEERAGKGTLDIPRGNEYILFVDDEETLVELGKDMLTGLGYKVVGKNSSLDALKIFRTRPDLFDLVITDMTMPNMTGVELAQELMRIRPDIPVILCTGFSEIITPEMAKSLGLRDFIMKPLVKRQIATAIRSALDQKG